ncbi:hypothetical protein BC829DRAFT_403761 [Chytridium lagenaria]|nr:hypothetical protein BC829DRAFT_403761 [Chytridium lagenaria]
MEATATSILTALVEATALPTANGTMANSSAPTISTQFFNTIVRAGTFFSSTRFFCLRYYIIPTILFVMRRKFNAISVPGYWLSLLQATLHFNSNTGLGLWFFCVALKGLRLLYLFRFSESKAAWRRSIVNGTHSGVLPSSASGLSGGSNPIRTSLAPSLAAPVLRENHENTTYPPKAADTVAVELASGRLHLPLNNDSSQSRDPYSFDTNESSPCFCSRSRVGSERCFRAFGPNGSFFGNVSNIGEVNVVRSGTFSQETCSQFSWPFFPLLGIEIIFTAIVFPVILYLLRNVRDNHGIRKDILIAIIFSFVAVTAHFTLSLTQKFSLLVTNYFIIPVWKSFQEEKSRMKNLEMGLSLASFNKILDDPAMIREFKRFCIRVQTNSFFLFIRLLCENIMFYEEVRHLKAKVHSSTASFATTTQMFAEGQDTQLRSNASFKQSYLQRKLFGGVLNSSQTQSQRSIQYEMRGSLETVWADPMRSSVDIDPVPSPITTTPSLTSILAPLNVTIDGDDSSEARTASMEDKRPVPDNMKASYFLVHKTFTAASTAPLEINIPADVRNAIALAFETGQVTVDVFDGAVEYVVDNMFYNSFSKFYSSISANGGGVGGFGRRGQNGVRRRRILG